MGMMEETQALAQAAVPAGTGSDIRDIVPPVPIPSVWDWLGWGLAVAAAAATAWWLWRLWLRRSTRLPVIPEVPPHRRARQRLEAALALLDRPKEFCIAVSDALRFYLEERFELRAPERTTEEFLAELQRSDALLPDQKQGLGEFLQRCDLVKFARYEPGRSELLELHGVALRLVEETAPWEPNVEGGSGGEPAAARLNPAGNPGRRDTV